MKSTSFKDILEKCKEGADSIEEVYSNLAYLTTNYDKEIEKIQKQLEDEKTRANNEEFVRHEAEKDLEDMRKLQAINFSVIVGGLIEKPKKEFEKQIEQTTKKMLVTLILSTIICIGIIISTFYYSEKNNIIHNNKNLKNSEIEKLINEIKMENTKLKKYIESTIQKQVPEKNKEELLILNKPKEKPIEMNIKKEEVILKPQESTFLDEVDNQDKFMENVLFLISNYDKKYKLSGKNNTRILYKMFLLDLAPFKHDTILQEIKLFAKNYTYIPTLDEIKIWDKQMLYIYTKMLEKIKNIPESKITPEMRTFHNYKKDDATIYSGWEYLGERNLNTKKSLEKEIKMIKSHIKLNNN